MSKPIKKRKLTDEQLVILDMWLQYSYRSGKKHWSGGHGTLEGAEAYLKMKEIINSWGNKRPEIIW